MLLTRSQLRSVALMGATALYDDLAGMLHADRSAMPGLLEEINLFTIMNEEYDLGALPAEQRVLIDTADGAYAENCGPVLTSHGPSLKPIPLPDPPNSVSEQAYVCAALYDASLMETKFVAKQLGKHMAGIAVRAVITVFAAAL